MRAVDRPAAPENTERAALDKAVLAARDDGDEQAFCVLYRAVQPGLLRYLRVLVGDENEDVAAETWLQVARDLASFTGDFDGMRGWVVTIARHRALDHLRRRRRRPPATSLTEALVGLADLAGGEDAAQAAMDALSTESAIALITALPRDQAEAVLLRVVMGLDAKACGRVLGKRPGAVRTAAHRGLRRLAEQLDRHREARQDPTPSGRE